MVPKFKLYINNFEKKYLMCIDEKINKMWFDRHRLDILSKKRHL